MSTPTDDSSSPPSARLLRGAALTFVVLGGGIAGWGIDKWIRYPEARASQFGLEAPLWPAFVGFVLLATCVGVILLWTAARRIESGEDLFEKRDQRRPTDEFDQS